MKEIRYKNGMIFKGPAKYKPKFMYAKGSKGKREVFEYLKNHREQYPQYWFDNNLDTPKCVHEVKMLVRGKWGPHNAKKQCAECGKWIKWVSVCK